MSYRPPLTEEKLRQAIEERRLFTPDQAAEALGVTRNVVDVWACREQWDRLRLGRKVWFWADDVYDTQHKLRLRAAEDATRGRNGKFVAQIAV